MRRIALLAIAVGFLMPLLASAPAMAQATRTWVSGVGDDVNPCSRTAPCQTFAGAISKTAAGGEIDCLDPGDFGPVTIAQSVTIDCGAGQVGGIGLTSSGDAVNITATSGTVVLRNLTLNGFSSGNYGIAAAVFNGTLIVQNCKIHGFLNAG